MTEHLPPNDPLEDEPIDVFAIGADDRLLDELAQDLTGDLDDDDPAAVFLQTWRASLLPHDLPAPPAAPVAEPPTRRSLPMIAAAAAIVALLLGTAAIGSRGAGPDDMLWPLTKLLWPDRIESVAAAENAGIALDRARLALADGEPPQASVVLTSAAVDISKVQPRDGRALLDEDYQELWTEVEGAMAATASGTAVVVLPTRGSEPTTSGSSSSSTPRSTTSSAPPSTGNGTGSRTAPAPPPIVEPGTPSTSTTPQTGAGTTTTSPSTTTTQSTTTESTTTSPTTSTTTEPPPSTPPTPVTTQPVDPTTPTSVAPSSSSSPEAPQVPQDQSPAAEDPQGDLQRVAPLLDASVEASHDIGEN